jgi:hypothetical protein
LGWPCTSKRLSTFWVENSSTVTRTSAAPPTNWPSVTSVGTTLLAVSTTTTNFVCAAALSQSALSDAPLRADIADSPIGFFGPVQFRQNSNGPPAMGSKRFTYAASSRRSSTSDSFSCSGMRIVAVATALFPSSKTRPFKDMSIDGSAVQLRHRRRALGR